MSFAPDDDVTSLSIDDALSFQSTPSIYDKVIHIPEENELRLIVDSYFSLEGGAYPREHVGEPIISMLSGKSLSIWGIAIVLNAIEHGKYAAVAKEMTAAASSTDLDLRSTSLIGYKLLSLFCDRDTMGLLWLGGRSSQDLLPLRFAEMLIDVIIERPKGECLSSNEGRLAYFGPMPCLLIHQRFLTYDPEEEKQKQPPSLCDPSKYFGRLANIASSLTIYHNFVPALLYAAREHYQIMDAWSKSRIISALKRYRDISALDPEYESFDFAFMICKEMIPTMWCSDTEKTFNDSFKLGAVRDALDLIANLHFDSSDGGDLRLDALAELIPNHLSKDQIVNGRMRDAICRIVMILARAATRHINVEMMNSCTIESAQLPFKICCKYEKYAAQWTVHVVDEEKDINLFVHG